MTTFIIIWLIVNVGAYILWVRAHTKNGKQEMTLSFRGRKITGLLRMIVVVLIAVFFIPVAVFCGEIG